MTQALVLGAVYTDDQGNRVRVHYFNQTSVMMEVLYPSNTHPFRIVRRSDGKLHGIFRTRTECVQVYDTWYR